MPYVGNKPEVGNFRKCDAITTSATATYNLLVGGVAVNPNQNQCIVSLNGVIQSSGNSYTIANSQITMASALTSSDVIDFILILGDTLDVGVPSDDTVDASKITANIITGQTALGATPADTDELLISDAGTLKRVDYSHLKSSVVNRPNAQPLIINGDMQIAQRATSKTGMKASGIWVCDRWDYHESGSVPEYTMTQESLTSGDAFADGFSKSLKFDCTTAQTSLSATEYNYMRYKFEGQNLQLFKKGTANAEKYTLSFWVKATKTGTNICELYDNTNTRHCSIAYTVSSTNTWEKKVVNVPADTTGSIVNTNALGMEIRFWLLAGSNYTSGTLATTWASVTAANSAVGQVNNADSTSNNWEITGVQLEVGEYTSSTLPPFQHETYAENLLRCQRYCVRWEADQSYSSFAQMAATTGSEAQGAIQLPVQMRTASPTFNSDGNFELYGENSSPNVTGLSTATAECGKIVFHLKCAATLTQGSGYLLRSDNNTSAWIQIQTEL